MSAGGDDAALRQELKDAQQQLKEWDRELNRLHEKNGGLDLQVQTLESEKKLLQSELSEVQRQRLMDLRQLSTQTAPLDSKNLEIPDAATLLNQLKTRRKKSKADLGDIEAILEMLPELPAQQP